MEKHLSQGEERRKIRREDDGEDDGCGRQRKGWMRKRTRKDL